MATPVKDDFLHSMRFHVGVVGNMVIGGEPLLNLPQAGFSNCTTPEATVESVEYREGQMVYTRKQPGNPTVSDLTMSRGVTRMDSSFWHWLRAVIEGNGEYRADLQIKHYHRDFLPGPSANNAEPSRNGRTDQPAKLYTCFNAFPIRHKVAADMDATASEISVMELDVVYEYFTVEPIAGKGAYA